MTVSTPFSAPAWPPETGASMKPNPCSFACASSSRAISAEAVVWSTNTAPFFTPWKAPFDPSVTSRRSLSLPTQHITKSWPSAAAFGVAALRPPYCPTHFCALAAVRLYTVTSWPPLFLRCPAMGYPMTPRPRKATFAILSSVEHCRASTRIPISESDCDAAAPASTMIALTRAAPLLWCCRRTCDGGEQGTSACGSRKRREPGGNSARQNRHAVGRGRRRRQGVLFHHRGCRRRQNVGTGASACRRGRAGVARRAICPRRIDGRAQSRRCIRSPAAACATFFRARNAAWRVDARRARRGGGHRGCLGQGRSRKINHCGQSRARLERARPQGRHPRCRYLRSLAAEAPCNSRAPADHWRDAAQTDHALWPHCHVHPVPPPSAYPPAFARPDGYFGAHADVARGRVGKTRRHGGRYAARHRRRPTHHGAAGAAQRRGYCVHSTGPRADRRQAGRVHVPARQRAGARDRRKHELFSLP